MYNFNYTFGYTKGLLREAVKQYHYSIIILNNSKMKKLILFSAIALLGFASCKKEAVEPGKPTTVEYVVVGQKLKITYNDESGLLFINTEVNGEYKHKFEAKTIQEAYISFRLEPNTESQSVLVQLKVNGFVINEFKHNHIKGADDVNGKFSVKIKKLTPEH